MNFEFELENRNMSILVCSKKSGIPYATLYPIIKGKVDVGTCSYYTVEKLARVLGYRPDQIVYHKDDFQTFRNNLHHKIKIDELETILEIIEKEEVEYYRFHRDFARMLYLVATVDYISKKNGIPLCEKYNEMRNMKLEEPLWIGDSALTKPKEEPLPEFSQYNIMEGDLYDAV